MSLAFKLPESKLSLQVAVRTLGQWEDSILRPRFPIKYSNQFLLEYAVTDFHKILVHQNELNFHLDDQRTFGVVKLAINIVFEDGLSSKAALKMS